MPSAPPTIARRALDLVEEALGSARVVALSGARQVGKTTLARALAKVHRGTFLSLDDPTTLESVRRDPLHALQQPPPVVVDEFQLAGDRLLRAVKAAVDAHPGKGRFLLTGSTRFLTVPTLSESLAGRVRLIDLWPLAQSEIRGRRTCFIDRLFGPLNALLDARNERRSRVEVFELVCAGGFPEARTLSPRARRGWFDSYVQTVTQRDATEIARIQQVGQLPNVLRHLAARTGQEIKASEVAVDAGMARTTLASYLTLLEALHAWYRVPAWSRNLSQKLIRHAKGHLTDAGLAAHLVGASPATLAGPAHRASGPLLETFVAGELAREATWADQDVRLHHMRDRDGAEVDLLLETREGRIACVEVKCASSVERSDFRTIDRLHDRLASQFACGVVLYLGTEARPFGPRRAALPITSLWAP